MKRHFIAVIGCLILLLVGLGFFLGLQQANAVSTMTGELHGQEIRCDICHTLDNDAAAPGSMGIRNSEATTVQYPTTYSGSKPFPCEFCHRAAGGFPNTTTYNYDKQLGFDATMMSYYLTPQLKSLQNVSHAPSGHPVMSYKYKLDADGLDNNGDGTADEAGETYDPVLMCTNCHDRDTAVYPTHEFNNAQTSVYTVQGRLLARPTGVVDPDPWDSTTVQLGSLAGWKSSHVPGTPPPVIDYVTYPNETDPQIYPFSATNFCLTCHDSDGFPKNPYAGSESLTTRVPPKVPYAPAEPGLVPDIKSFWDDMGHYVKQTTGVYLKQGDKLPCAVCHTTHNSDTAVSLLNEELLLDTPEAAMDHTPIEFCLRCHDQDHMGDADAIEGVPLLAGLQELVPPATHEGRVIPEHTLAGSYGNRSSCLGSFEIQNPRNNGCHMSPHAPRADCGGCHREEVVGALGKVAPRGDKRARGVSEDYYQSHPVNLSLDDPNPDIKAIKDHYFSRPERQMVPDPAPLGVNNSVYCTTCHNYHGDMVTSVDSTVLAGDGTMDDQAVLRMERPAQGLEPARLGYPDVCLQCHERIKVSDGQGGMRYYDNPHGGFEGAGGGQGEGAGMCNKCHSMHGRHPYSPNLQDITLEYTLHYGMFKNYNGTIENLIDTTTGVYQDISGAFYMKANNAHLIHDQEQAELCVKCHGVEPPPAGLDPRPPNMYFPHESNNFKRDTYYRDSEKTIRTNSVHLVDSNEPGTPWGQPVNVQLRCGSCHDPHGSDNYRQLRDTIKIGVAAAGESVHIVTGIRINAYYDTTRQKSLYYRSTLGTDGEPSLDTDGMTKLCTGCHSQLSNYFYDTTRYDTTIYMRHPMNVAVSRLNVTIYNFDRLVLQNKTTNPNDGEIFCPTCHAVHGADNVNLRKDENTETCQLYCHVEIVEK